MRSHKSSGFTLIELLVVIALIVVMATWAVPSFQALVERNRVAVEVMRLMGALGQARSTAITRRGEAVICPTRNQSECVANWKLPLMLFLNKDGTPGVRADDDPLLRTWSASEMTSLVYNGFGSDRYIRYRPNGRPKGHNGTYVLCNRQGAGVEVIISASGRVRTRTIDGC